MVFCLIFVINRIRIIRRKGLFHWRRDCYFILSKQGDMFILFNVERPPKSALTWANCIFKMHTYTMISCLILGNSGATVTSYLLTENTFSFVNYFIFIYKIILVTVYYSLLTGILIQIKNNSLYTCTEQYNIFI